MYEITVAQADFTLQQEKRDLYCKIIANETVQTKVEMDAIKVAHWGQSFRLTQSNTIKIQLHHWLGEGKDVLLFEKDVEIATSELGKVTNIQFDENNSVTLKLIQVEAATYDSQIKQFQKYLNETGLEQAFKLIFAEILTKKIPQTEVFVYAAMRLRQMAEDLKMFFNNVQNILSQQHKMSQLLNNISEVQQDDEPDQFLESQDQ